MTEDFLLSKCILEKAPGFLGIFDKDSRYCQVNREGSAWLGFNNPNELMGLSHDAVKCRAVELAPNWIKQDSLTLESDRPQQFISYTCYAKDTWRLVLGEKVLFSLHNGEKRILCHFSEITDLGIFDLSFFLKKNNGFLKKEQFSLTLSHQFPYPTDKKLSRRESECLFFFIRGHSMKQIANILNLSQKTVEQYISFLKYKFNCYNKNDLISKAISLGYMNFLPPRLIL